MMGEIRWSDIEAGLRARLLPPVIPPGAMPFFSLSYLLVLFFPLVMPRFPPVDWTTTLLSVLMFPAMVVRYNMGWSEMLLIDKPALRPRGRSHCRPSAT